MRNDFRFKQFTVTDQHSPMKVNTDAVLLGAWAGHPDPQKILDVGTGCGVIALMMAQRFNAEITAIDIHEGACRDARHNFTNSPWPDKLKVYHGDFHEFFAVTDSKFDLIVSNPPFFNNSLQSPLEHRNTARHNVKLTHADLITGTVQLLEKQGFLAVILPISSFLSFEKAAMKAGLFNVKKRMVHPVAGKPAHRVLAAFSKNPPEKIEQDPLTLHFPGNIPTDEYKNLTRDFYPAF